MPFVEQARRIAAGEIRLADLEAPEQRRLWIGCHLEKTAGQIHYIVTGLGFTVSLATVNDDISLIYRELRGAGVIDGAKAAAFAWFKSTFPSGKPEAQTPVEPAGPGAPDSRGRTLAETAEAEEAPIEPEYQAATSPAAEPSSTAASSERTSSPSESTETSTAATASSAMIAAGDGAASNRSGHPDPTIAAPKTPAVTPHWVAALVYWIRAASGTAAGLLLVSVLVVAATVVAVILGQPAPEPPQPTASATLALGSPSPGSSAPPSSLSPLPDRSATPTLAPPPTQAPTATPTLALPPTPPPTPGPTVPPATSVSPALPAPPTLVLPASQILEAIGPTGTIGTFIATATDAVDSAVGVTCAPASGSTFPLGTTPVTCTARDLAGHETSGTFSVTVKDTRPPILSVPLLDLGKVVEATGVNGAIVTFSPSARDDVDGVVLVTCTPPSGSTFAVGNTTVTCNTSDRSANVTSTAFSVGVTDTRPPSLSLPPGLTMEATGPNGAVATFPTSATDLVDGAVRVTCTPPSGSILALGSATIVCAASDRRGNSASGSFGVTVRDTTAPSLSLPANQTIQATGPGGATATFMATASDLVDGAVQVICTPATGSTFSVGATTVGCRATDRAGNIATGAFTITVVGAPTQPPPPPTPATGYVLDRENAAALGGYFTLHYDSDQTYHAASFVPSVTAKVARVTLGLWRKGNPAGNVWVEIWTGSSGSPSAKLGSPSASVTANSIPAPVYSDINFDWASGTGPLLNAGTTYWIVFAGDYPNSPDVDVVKDVVSLDTGSTVSRRGNASGAWFSLDSGPLTYDLIFKEYFQPP